MALCKGIYYLMENWFVWSGWLTEWNTDTNTSLFESKKKLDLTLNRAFVWNKHSMKFAIHVILELKFLHIQQSNKSLSVCRQQTWLSITQLEIELLKIAVHLATIGIDTQNRHIGGFRGDVPGACPPKGPDSFFLTYKIFET